VYRPEIYDKLIPKDHILYKINQQIDFSFVNETCKDLYSQDIGRPVKNLPEIMFRSAIVQYLNDYSDRDMEEAASLMNPSKILEYPLDSSKIQPDSKMVNRNPCIRFLIRSQCTW